MQKMAPHKGGTALPSKIEMIVISIVGISGCYAWFVDPGSWLVGDGGGGSISTTADNATSTSISSSTSSDSNDGINE